MRVKICGITNLYSAEKAIEYGADLLGFVFAESSRQVTPNHVKEIVSQLKKPILKVGVFVNECPDTIRNIASFCQLDFIQLHGDEKLSDYQMITTNLIKAFSVRDNLDINKAANYPTEHILLDSPRGKYFGGTGNSFNWNLLKDGQLNHKKIILAGGLTVDNVAEAIEIVNPYMVDVSSGVETAGKKDVFKIREFIKNAKSKRGGNSEFTIVTK